MISPFSVELRAARIPVIGALAEHHWFVIVREGQGDRWEVWQHAHAGGESWGHLHRNLLPAVSGVGNGPSWVLREWEGDAAETVAARVERAIEDYPWRERYRYWPGPNSNTFVQWVLGEEFVLPCRAHGRRYALR